MDVDVAKLKEDAGAGRVNVDQAVKVCVKLVGTIQRLEAEIEELKRKLAEKNPTPRVNESYSVGAEEKRQEKRTGKRRNEKNLSAVAGSRQKRNLSWQLFTKTFIRLWMSQKSNACIRILDSHGA